MQNFPSVFTTVKWSDSDEARKTLSSAVLTAAGEKHKLGQEPRERIQSKYCRICQPRS